MCYMMGLFRPSGAIDIRFKILTKIPAFDFANSLGKLIIDDIGMATERRVVKGKDGSVNSIQLISSAALRNSKILPTGWREVLDLDTTLAVQSEVLDLSSAIHALVSRQAVGNIAQYQGLDDAQRTTYLSVFDSKISSAIKSVCKHATQVDSLTITCD
jgi:hypothetical protein